MLLQAIRLLAFANTSSCSEERVVDRVFIPHYSPLKERREHLTKQLNAYSLHDISEWVEVWNAENITQDVKSVYYTPVVTYDDPKAATFTNEITSSEISLALKHLHIFKQVVERKLHRVLVLEDDAVLVDNFEAKLGKYVQQLDAADMSWGLVCLGNELGQCHEIEECKRRKHGGPQGTSSNVYRKKRRAAASDKPYLVSVNNRMRTTGSYLLTYECALRILASGRLYPFSFPVDAQLNIVLDELASSSSCAVFWVEPSLVSQGSKSTKFESKARSKAPETADRIISYKQFIEQRPSHPHVYQVYHFVGIEYFKIGKYKQALKQIKRALKLKPDYADAWYNRALVEEKLGVENKRKGELAAYTSYRRAWRACSSGGVCSHPGRVQQAVAKLEIA
jgi:GR25 family glycosyltransferase involved in LPS biosynthesis